MYQEKRFSLGKATSLAPIMMGSMKLPKTAGSPGITIRKIMMMPWSVKNPL
jgi:hypothetical protein